MTPCSLLLQTYVKKCTEYNNTHSECIILRKMLLTMCVYKN